MPIHKKGWKEDLESYTSVSLTSVLGKLMKQIICSAILQHMQDNQGIRSSQYEFVKDRSCLTNMIPFRDKVICSIDEGNAGNVSMWTSVKPLTAFPTAFSRRN